LAKRPVGTLQVTIGFLRCAPQVSLADLESYVSLESCVSVPRGRRRTGEISGREALLKAALQAFSRQGYEGVSLRSLASQASVDMALVARIFGSKAALWRAVIGQLAARQVDHLQAIKGIAETSADDPREAMQRFIKLFAQISFEMPEFPAFLLQEASCGGARLDTIVQQLVAPFKAQCQPIILAAAQANVIRVCDAALFFGMLVSAISLPMVSPDTFSGRTQLDDDLKDAIAQQAIAMFVMD
jgi:AcrR family transcriptional regulator